MKYHFAKIRFFLSFYKKISAVGQICNTNNGTTRKVVPLHGIILVISKFDKKSLVCLQVEHLVVFQKFYLVCNALFGVLVVALLQNGLCFEQFRQ